MLEPGLRETEMRAGSEMRRCLKAIAQQTQRLESISRRIDST